MSTQPRRAAYLVVCALFTLTWAAGLAVFVTSHPPVRSLGLMLDDGSIVVQLPRREGELVRSISIFDSRSPDGRELVLWSAVPTAGPACVTAFVIREVPAGFHASVDRGVLPMRRLVIQVVTNKFEFLDPLPIPQVLRLEPGEIMDREGQVRAQSEVAIPVPCARP